MDYRFSKRIQNTPRSFIREILKVTQDPSVISFAGGLPNPELFPVQGIREAADKILRDHGPRALQYSSTEGDKGLREWIAKRYEKRGVSVHPDQVLITTGSQQALDLVGKIFIEPKDRVVLERPSYLGTIQAFAMYEPEFVTVNLRDQGPDPDQLAEILAHEQPKIFYSVPNFPNPSGLTYGSTQRQQLADLLARHPDTIFVEDDPYGELRFAGSRKPPVFSLTQGRSILLGSFSKIASPGMRLGWMAAPEEIIRMAVTAKQAADLHSSTFNQIVLRSWLEDNDLDVHIDQITRRYGEQARIMCRELENKAPKGTRFTRPEGGMFLWLTLPEKIGPCMKLFDRAIERKVAFVPGMPFYTDGSGTKSMRLNFSNSSPELIREGISRLVRCMSESMEQAG